MASYAEPVAWGWQAMTQVRKQWPRQPSGGPRLLGPLLPLLLLRSLVTGRTEGDLPLPTLGVCVCLHVPMPPTPIQLGKRKG